MSGLMKIRLNELDDVVGGTLDVVENPHKDYDYANLRTAPGMNSEVIMTVPNGSKVVPTGRIVKENGIDWYEVQVGNAGQSGWIAGSLIGR